MAATSTSWSGCGIPPRCKLWNGASGESRTTLPRVIDDSLCKRLKRMQKLRAEVEHEYLQVKAGRLHEAVGQLVASAADFVVPYTAWIEPYL